MWWILICGNTAVVQHACQALRQVWGQRALPLQLAQLAVPLLCVDSAQELCFHTSPTVSLLCTQTHYDFKKFKTYPDTSGFFMWYLEINISICTIMKLTTQLFGDYPQHPCVSCIIQWNSWKTSASSLHGKGLGLNHVKAKNAENWEYWPTSQNYTKSTIISSSRRPQKTKTRASGLTWLSQGQFVHSTIRRLGKLAFFTVQKQPKGCSDVCQKPSCWSLRLFHGLINV